MANEQDNKSKEKGSLTREEIILQVIKATVAGRRSGMGSGYIRDGYKYGNLAADLIFGIKKPEDVKDD